MATSREQRLASSRQEAITRRRKPEEPIGIKSSSESLTTGRAIVLMASANRSAKNPPGIRERAPRSHCRSHPSGNGRDGVAVRLGAGRWRRGGAWCDGDLRGRRTRPPGSRLGFAESPGYSMRSAFMGSMLAARRAGMNPATAADAPSATTAMDSVSGS